jgi:hypothetical protein
MDLLALAKGAEVERREIKERRFEVKASWCGRKKRRSLEGRDRWKRKLERNGARGGGKRKVGSSI